MTSKLPRLVSFSMFVCALGFGSAGASYSQSLEKVGTQHNSPVFVTTFPGVNSRVLVAERSKAQIITSQRNAFASGSGNILFVKSVFLDLADRATVVSLDDLEGLHSFAFHPNFLSADNANRFVYVRWSNTVDVGVDQFLRVAIERFAVPVGATSADIDSGETVFQVDLMASTGDHHGGQIAFDVDPLPGNGDEFYLYTGIGDLVQGTGGDCGGGCPPGANQLWSAQLDSGWAGTLVRFTIKSSEVAPMATDVIANGLRNPFGISVDPGDATGGGAGDVWVVDTGSNVPGELNVINGRTATTRASGNYANFGWPRWEGAEGTIGTDGGGQCLMDVCDFFPNNAPGDPPVYSLETSQASVVFSATPYRGSAVPSYSDQLLYCGTTNPNEDRLFKLDPLAPGYNAAADDLGPQLGMTVTGPSRFPSGSLLGVGRSFDGEELFLIRNNNDKAFRGGQIFQILPQ